MDHTKHTPKVILIGVTQIFMYTYFENFIALPALAVY